MGGLIHEEPNLREAGSDSFLVYMDDDLPVPNFYIIEKAGSGGLEAAGGPHAP